MMIGIIMAGGTGTRFWPLSRKSSPKQCLKIIKNNKTMLETTIDRFKPLISDEQIFISTGREVEKAIHRVLKDQYECIVEPSKKNTAAAIALSTLWAQHKLGASENEVIAFVGSDYYIKEDNIFRKTLKEAEKLAQQGYIVTIGIPPRYPSTGYGYILRDKELETSFSTAYTVRKFKEKPDEKTAKEYIKAGTYYWNSGMFVASIETLVGQFKKHSPSHIELLEQAKQDDFSETALKTAFDKMPSISFDYAIMEKTAKAAVIAGKFYWDDVGSWQALKKLLPAKTDNNSVKNANTVFLDAQNNLVVDNTSRKPLISLVGMEGVVVVNTEDAILICSQDESQEVKALVDKLKAKKRNNLLD